MWFSVHHVLRPVPKYLSDQESDDLNSLQTDMAETSSVHIQSEKYETSNVIHVGL